MNKPIDTSVVKVWKDNLKPSGKKPVLTTHALITGKKMSHKQKKKMVPISR
jgi:hypothetical protein